MFYSWLLSYADQVSALNVVRYISVRAFLSFFTAFFLCMTLGPHFIRRLVKRQLGQSIREDGPETHRKKKGTPTMGGGLILLSTLIPCLLWIDVTQPLVWAVLAITWIFGAIGYLDDSLKVAKKNSAGLPGRLRLVTEFMTATSVLAILVYGFDFSTYLHVPFFKDVALDLGAAYVFFGAFVIVGTANAVNLTDGLDGLAIVPVMIAATTLGLFAYVAGHSAIASYLQIPAVSGAGELVPVAMGLVAAGLGFLWFNAYPAQVFMGDVGSLSLGGFLGVMAVLTKNELLMVLLGGVFVIEALSVITQVLSFKLTGRRIFRMAPIHHHFELEGLTENKIIVRFWIVALLLAILSLSTLKLR